ncbi:MAG: biotin carboxylase N-terminal domain-containing protein [Acidobacteriota bacterium]
MFRRLLVANRGEVAVRVARTCRRLGISPVAVYSTADAGAGWLSHFDAAVSIGPGHPGKSYLNQSAVLQAAVQVDAQALHPGWGFLSENALFATRVQQLGIAWVGPTPNSIRRMGDKALARETVKSLGLPTIPGSDGLLLDAKQARALAESIGYPVLLKATAGGGGRGMRVCRSAADVDAAFAAASGEAAAAFGNAGLYLEKFVERGRHIEFQVMGDRFGKVLHFGERECSVQRRHQKLIEEAPSPVIDRETRVRFGAQLCAALSRLGYVGAGTIEMLRASDGALYFMEMNTRLQVEHPVTEAICGADLVELQLRVAAGERLALEQDQIEWSGHAIEARLNAEEVADDFRPSPGTITRFDLPTDRGPGSVRVETHITAPAEVPPFYDSLVAKVIAHGATRADAIATLKKALASARIEGVPTSIPAHLAVLDAPAFISGQYDTDLLSTLDMSGKRS